jgi:SOS response regulatory protein OraA/RecX
LEIVTHLKKYTSDPDLINQTVSRLEETHFLDDIKFAAWLVESRSRSRPRGKRLLLHELKSKGINIKEEPIEINEADLAFKALEKKQKTWSGLSAKEFRLKATRFLYSRGFSWEVIEPVIRKAYNDSNVN